MYNTQYEDSLSHHLMSDVWINNDENAGEWASSNFFRWVIDEVNVNMDYDKLLFKDKDSEGLYDIVLPEHTFYRGPNITTHGYDQNNNIPPFSFAEYYPRRYDPDYDTRVDTNLMKKEPSSESEDSESYMNGVVFHNSTQDVYIPPESYDYRYDLSGTNNETSSSSESDDSERPRSVRPLSRLSAKKTGKLWEFLRNLLLDKRTCPSLIKWDNYDEGTFKFVQSEKVAQLWGNRKNNTRMNYEKLSRAMRYYYRSQVLLPVAGKRLVYRFGPQATGWRTKNPIL